MLCFLVNVIYMMYTEIHKDLGRLLVSSLILRTMIIHCLNNEFKVVYKIEKFDL